MSNASWLCYQSICNAISHLNVSHECGSLPPSDNVFGNLTCCIDQSGDSASSTKTITLTILASVFGACLALLLGLVAFHVYMTNRKADNKSTLNNKAQYHPSPNPLQSMMDLTLVVTDIESSTTLWETVHAEAMNKTLNQHHSLIRKLLKKNGGQEEATEGDSFILSFSTPHNALSFSLDLQTQLMELDYDEAVLRHPVCAPVWMKPSSDFTKRHGRAWKGQFGLLDSSLLVSEIQRSSVHHLSSENLPDDNANNQKSSKIRLVGKCLNEDAQQEAERDLSRKATSTFSLRLGIADASPPGSSRHLIVADCLTLMDRKFSDPVDKDISLTLPPARLPLNSSSAATGHGPALEDSSPRLSFGRTTTLEQHLEFQQETTLKVSERIGQRISSVSSLFHSLFTLLDDHIHLTKPYCI